MELRIGTTNWAIINFIILLSLNVKINITVSLCVTFLRFVNSMQNLVTIELDVFNFI